MKPRKPIIKISKTPEELKQISQLKKELWLRGFNISSFARLYGFSFMTALVVARDYVAPRKEPESAVYLAIYEKFLEILQRPHVRGIPKDSVKVAS